MDTVDLVIVLLAALVPSTIGLAWLTFRLWRALCAAQSEIARLVAQSRPRSPQSAAGYDTGLVETSSPEPAGSRALG